MWGELSESDDEEAEFNADEVAAKLNVRTKKAAAMALRDAENALDKGLKAADKAKAVKAAAAAIAANPPRIREPTEDDFAVMDDASKGIYIFSCGERQ